MMSNNPEPIFSWADHIADPLEDRLATLSRRLGDGDGPADEAGSWPEGLWAILKEAGATRWSLPREYDGEGCSRPTLLHRYARVAEGSLTSAFILSQYDAGVRRLLATLDRPGASYWMAQVKGREAFLTVGLSQLTTSRRHGAQALTATEGAPGTYRLDGVMPWVTAAERADVIITGAVVEGGGQLLLAVPTGRSGLRVRTAFSLAALQASRTSEVVCEGVQVDPSDVLAGPSPDVMAQTGTGGTGGLETSALALGQARAALTALASESPRRPELAEPVEALGGSWRDAWSNLMAAAGEEPGAPAASEVRAEANALVLRATQAYLTARKGSGFLTSDPAQRWTRQALFFLVWSCPGPVAEASIRDLAGLCSP